MQVRDIITIIGTIGIIITTITTTAP